MSPMVTDPLQQYKELHSELYPDRDVFVTVERDSFAVYDVDKPDADPRTFDRDAFQREIDNMRGRLDRRAELAAKAERERERAAAFEDDALFQDLAATVADNDDGDDDGDDDAATVADNDDDFDFGDLVDVDGEGATDADKARAAAELDAPPDALDKQLEKLESRHLYGIQVYYSVWSQVWEAGTLRQAVLDVDAEPEHSGYLPAAVLDFIDRTDTLPPAAFRKSASVKGKGVKTTARNDHEVSAIKTEIVPDVDGTFVMYIKSVARDGEDDAQLEYVKCGLLVHDPDHIDATAQGIVWRPEPEFARAPNEKGLKSWQRDRIRAVNGLVQAIRDKYNSIVHKINDVQVRQNLLLPWLADLHRICVRASGGVYVVPLPKETTQAIVNQRAAVVAEMAAMQRWLDLAGVGEMTLAALYDGKLSPMSQHRQAAIAELTDELKLIQEKLQTYDKVQASTRKSAAGSMLKRLNEVKAQIKRLNQTFNEDILIKGIQLDALTNQATALIVSADKEITEFRAGAKERKTNKRKAEARKKSEEPRTDLEISPDDEIYI